MNAVDFTQPVEVVKGFNGLWARGIGESCPTDHLTECFNCNFTGNDQVHCRPGMDYSAKLPGKKIISFFSHLAQNAEGQTTNKLFLTDDGKLYDDSGIMLTDDWAGADDVAALNLYGRVIMSPRRLGRALPGEFTYYYDGKLHKLGGAAPEENADLAESSDTGHVSVGTHTIAISYIYKYGYISRPSPLGTVESTGDKKIALYNIPIDTSNTDIAGRIILVSKANETDLFILPDQILKEDPYYPYTEEDPVEIDFTDTELVDDANYLFDVRKELPSCAAIKLYRNRLVLVGPYDEPDTALLSNDPIPSIFETFDVDSAIKFPRDYRLNSLTTALIIRDSLYLFKPHGVFVTQDNGDVPSTWSVSIVDSTIGAYDQGVSSYATSLSAQDVYDSSIITDETGLLIFNGSFSDRLSYKIDALWQTIRDEDFPKVQIAHNPWMQQVFILIPVCDTYALLMMDYKDGLSAKTVKFSIWRFGSDVVLTNPCKIAMSAVVENYASINVVHRFELCFGDENIYDIWKGKGFKRDLNQYPIKQVISTAPLPSPAMQGDMTVFTCLRLRIYGTGAFKMRIWNLDRTVSVQVKGFLLQSMGQELTRLINFVGEKAIISVYSDPDTPSSWFSLNRIDVFGKSLWKTRPALSQPLTTP